MKIALSTILLLFIFISCKKDDIEPLTPEMSEPTPNECLIVGDFIEDNFHFVNYSPIITLQSHNSYEIHEIDMDMDGINDFELNLYCYFAFAGTWFKGSSVRIKSLHPAAEVSMDPYIDSTVTYPTAYALMYHENDTLHQTSMWDSTGDYLMISSNGDDPTDLCDAPACPMISHGPWFGLSDKHIGVRMCGTNLGWIKISLPTTSPESAQKLVIQQWGYDGT